jgi:hypothetical protein
MHVARKSHPCGECLCRRTIEPGELYVRHVAFPGDDGHEEGTRPWVIRECFACANERGDWVRQYYKVPARVGMSTHVDGSPCRIVGFTDGITVLRDDGTVTYDHPTWRVVYHTPDGDMEFGMENDNA